LQAHRDRAVRRLIRYAYAKVPYYRRLMDGHGVRPEDIGGAADIRRIPVTDRDTLQELTPDEITARGTRPDRLKTTRTSGATGKPIFIRRTWWEQRLHSLFWLRARHYFGLRPTDRIASISFVRSGPGHGLQLHQIPLRALGLYRKHRIDCCLQADEIADALYELRPDWVGGQAGAVARVGRLLMEDPRPPLRPRAVAAGGQMITPGMRRDIARGFDAPFHTGYASHEFGLIAWECKQTGKLHVCDDSLILELLEDGQPVGHGERGEVVGTDLLSYAMPFIRYSLGDLAVRGGSACPCGLPFSTIERIEGRTVDFFPLPDGRTLHPYRVVGAFLNIAPWVRRYQLVQEATDRIRLRIVPYRTPTPEQLEHVDGKIRPILGPEVDFRIELTDELDIRPGEKYRILRSRVTEGVDGSTEAQGAGD
jgi:phenylacetate-CoA ligase